MNFKRGLFIGVLMLLFVFCYNTINQKIDELSRYQYANAENRDIILEHLTIEEISVLIDRQYLPEQFMHYLGIEGFNIQNVDWYNHAESVNEMSIEEVIVFVNSIRDKVSLSTFKIMTQHYSLNQLQLFYIEENTYREEFSLIADPTSVFESIEEGKTLFTYVPKDLVKVKNLPMEKGQTIYLQSNVFESLGLMFEAILETDETLCGNMTFTQGYVSFETQDTLYQNALIEYGEEEVLNYANIPGTSIYQLGNVIKLVPVVNSEENVDEEDLTMTPQQTWLMEHAREYGFVFINDSSTVLNEFELQYVGVEESTSNENEGEE